MKEIFVVKKSTETSHIYYKRIDNGTGWTDNPMEAHAHHSYMDANMTIRTIAQAGERFQIEKLFVTP